MGSQAVMCASLYGQDSTLAGSEQMRSVLHIRKGVEEAVSHLIPAGVLSGSVPSDVMSDLRG